MDYHALGYLKTMVILIKKLNKISELRKIDQKNISKSKQ